MTELLTLALMALLLLLKGFFSGSEIALVSADRVKLRHKSARGSSGARLAVRLLQRPTQLLTTTLLGTNLSSIALTTVGTLLMVGLFGGSGELLALLVFTPLFLILGEIVPKSVYQQKADVLVPIIAYPLAWLRTILAPLVWLFSSVAGLAARLIGGRTDESGVLRDQFFGTVHMAEVTGASEAFSRGQVRRVLRFAQMTAVETMWPIAEVQVADRNAGMSDLLAIRSESGQRLIPLYDGSYANITAMAMMESWDMMDPDLAERAVDDVLSPVCFVPGVQRVSEILEMLRDDPSCTAVVVDELGHAIGFITLQLLVRRTLGTDANPVAERQVAIDSPKLAITGEDGRVRLDARIPIAKVNEILGTDISTLKHNTISGLALSRFGRLPQQGDRFEEQGFTFSVLEVSDRSIDTLVAEKGRGKK